MRAPSFLETERSDVLNFEKLTHEALELCNFQIVSPTSASSGHLLDLWISVFWFEKCGCEIFKKNIRWLLGELGHNGGL